MKFSVSAVLGRERLAVHEIAAKARQRRAVARFGVGRARLGVLPGEAADPDDRLFHAIQHDETHLQQHLELLHDVLGRAVVEGLGAVAALQHERLAALRRRDASLQVVDLPRRDERRQRRQAPDRIVEVAGVGVGRHLARDPRLPARRVPGVVCGGLAHGAMVPQRFRGRQKRKCRRNNDLWFHSQLQRSRRVAGAPGTWHTPRHSGAHQRAAPRGPNH